MDERLFADVFGPQVWLFALHSFHQCDATRIVEHGQHDAALDHPILGTEKSFVLADDHAGNLKEDRCA